MKFSCCNTDPFWENKISSKPYVSVSMISLNWYFRVSKAVLRNTKYAKHTHLHPTAEVIPPPATPAAFPTVMELPPPASALRKAWVTLHFSHTACMVTALLGRGCAGRPTGITQRPGPHFQRSQ